jgi:hypothetical protein
MSSFTAVLQRLTTVAETLELARTEVRALQHALQAEAASRAARAPPRPRATFQQLCDCACEEEQCLNCPNQVDQRKDAETLAMYLSRPVPVAPVPAVSGMKRRRVKHVNRPESAGEEEEEGEGSGGDDGALEYPPRRRPRTKRRLTYAPQPESRKVGCFPSSDPSSGPQEEGAAQTADDGVTE